MIYDKNLFKLVTLDNGITKSVYNGPVPIIPEPVVTPSRASTDNVEVNFRGTGLLLSPDHYNFPKMTYATLAAAFAGAPTQIYSAVNSYGTRMTDVSGQYISVQKFISLFYPGISATGNDFSVFCAKPNSVITMTSGGFTYKILGSQIMSGQRRYITDSSVDVVEAGFVLTEGRIRFAIGQLNWAEENYEMFATLADGGTTIEFESYSSASPKFANFNAYIGNVGSIGTICAPSAVTVYDFYSGDHLRFAIDDQNDLLNRGRLYYNVNESSTAPTTPDPIYTYYIFNEKAAKYTAGGVNYPDSIVLTESDYYFIVVAYGPGSQNSTPLHFRFHRI